MNPLRTKLSANDASSNRSTIETRSNHSRQTKKAHLPVALHTDWHIAPYETPKHAHEPSSAQAPAPANERGHKKFNKNLIIIIKKNTFAFDSSDRHLFAECIQTTLLFTFFYFVLPPDKRSQTAYRCNSRCDADPNWSAAAASRQGTVRRRAR